MLKGVNKQVLEICETENGYFEKAIFFVKPEYSGFSEGRLRENARRELKSAGLPPHSGAAIGKSKVKKILAAAAVFAAGALFGAIIAAVI